jgi:large subunit ribosomal protein L32
MHAVNQALPGGSVPVSAGRMPAWFSRRGAGCPAEDFRYPSRSLMAVPKQKQSHSRTSKRRAQHKISAPTYNACPTCHSPRLPHRVCPTCGSYGGREVVHTHDHDHDHEH